MKLLSLDIGTRRTGVAYGETESDFIMALDTIAHKTDAELIEKVSAIVKHRKIEKVIVGLPLLLGGEEGAQSRLVRSIANALTNATGLDVMFLDERYTSVAKKNEDPDARAACELLQIALEKRRKSIDF